MKKIAVSLFLILLSFTLTACQLQSGQLEKKQLSINQQTLQVEVAKTTKQQTLGLGGRQALGEDCGMLFEFSDYQIRNFWMKGMNFPLDIIWLKDNQIISFSENVPLLDSSGSISRVSSQEPVNRVLEVKAGWVKENDVKIGDLAEGID